MKSNKYEWRGLMLDTVRHMPSLDYLYKTVDKLNKLDLNKLHLHLSDDQGFRLEIEKYPKLNTISSFRSETAIDKNFSSKWTNFAPFIGDGKKYGGFYTKKELKSLVEYARGKNVEIIPEVDIPGHMTAILAAYPEFSAGQAPSDVKTYWGIFNNVISDQPESINFLKDIFDEVCEIFTSKYIHIGGDEVPLDNYSNDLNIPQNILREIVNYLNTKNRTVILWDEAASLAIETDSVIMNWRKLEYGINHLIKGGKVIFCPNNFFYLDYYQKDPSTEPLAIGGYLPIEIVSSFKLGKDIIEKYGKSILGIQANLWTEYTNTEKKMDYMLYPRLKAFSQLKPE